MVHVVAVETVEERQEHVVGKEEATLRGFGVLFRGKGMIPDEKDGILRPT